MQSVAIIPARGGSQRIPGKNLIPVAGHPLLAWTIEAAIDAWVDVVLVSTDDGHIAHVARQYGATVVERPAALATSTSPTEPTLLHAVDWLHEQVGSEPEHVVLLQCTSPLRTHTTINRALEIALETGCDAVVGVHPTIEWYFTGSIGDDDGQFHTVYDPLHRLRTQDVAPRYKENGSVYVTRTAHLRATGCRMGGDMRPVVMSPVEGIDIDDWADLELAAHHLERRCRQTGSQPALRLG